MALIAINTDLSTRELRMFAALWFPLFWLMIGLIAWGATGSEAVPAVALGIWIAAAGVAVAGFALPKWIKPVYLGMTYAVLPIGMVVSFVILALIYYLLVTPTGLLMRAFGQDPMQRRLDPAASTYWVALPPVPPNARYFRQF